MKNVNEQVMRLYEDGVLLEEIQKTLKLPVKSIVDIIFDAKSDKARVSKNIKNKKSNWYVYFCEYLFENKSLDEIIAGRVLTRDVLIEMLGNVARMETVPSDVKEALVKRLALEIGESKANTAKLLGLEFKQSFATALRRIWR